jgi:hypothetical protein
MLENSTFFKALVLGIVGGCAYQYGKHKGAENYDHERETMKDRKIRALELEIQRLKEDK